MRRATHLAGEGNREKIEALKEALENKIESGDRSLEEKEQGNRELVVAKIDALAALTKQYQEQQQYALEVASTERRDSATALSEEQRRALEQAERERSKSAEVLERVLNDKISSGIAALASEVKSGDVALLQHVSQTGDALKAALSAQKELSDAQVASSKEAVGKTERNTEKQLESLGALIDSKLGEISKRQSDFVSEVQGLRLGLGKAEARGGGEKEYASEQRSTISLVIAVIAVIASVAIALITSLR